uniref:Protein KRI1 homolog n=1 Tax=Loa loa TaxID=7209 RepID=A0A1I7VX65_LOALO
MSKFYLYLDGDADGDDKLTINKAYAKRYNNWRHLEELQKLKDKYGDGVEDDDDTNSSCSEEPAVWSAEHEKDFLRTLSALKTHDLRLYSGQKFFTAEDKGTAIGNKFKKKDAPMFLKDYERKLVLEKRGDISEDEEEKKTSKHGYYEEQELIKRELKAVLAKQSDDMEPLLRQRIKAEDEVKNEEDQYYEWLKGQRDEDLPGVEELKGLKEAWNDTNLDESEKFLRDYLLNKKYDVEGDDGVPLYEEIVNVEKDEEELERENEFERKYNFRYEEPDQDFIKHYPRIVKQSLRKKDERRKQKRDAYKERKKSAKQARKDEIKELKTLKKKQIEDKLKKLKKLAGDEDLPLNVDDLEADFDPTAYDKRMKEIFSSQYYKEIVDENKEKPVFSDASDVSTDDSDYDSFEVHKERKENADNITEDCNDDEALVPEKKSSRKKKKRNSRFIEVVLKKKPLFNPEEKSFEEYFNEYYALEYEDIIGDGLITKFKYRSVPANDFGITVDELLNADDRQLNAWASLKKATAYRSEAEELYDIKAYKKKALNLLKKKRIFSTDFGGKNSNKLADNASGMEHICQMGKATAKKKRTKKSTQNCPDDVKLGERSSAVLQEGVRLLSHFKNAGSRKNHSKYEQFNSTVDINDDRLRAYGINPKKYKNKLFHRQENL